MGQSAYVEWNRSRLRALVKKERKTFSKTDVVRQSSENTSEATYQQHSPERMAQSYLRPVLWGKKFSNAS